MSRETTNPEAGMRLALVRARYHVERSPCSDRDEVLTAIDEALAARAQPPAGEAINSAYAAYGALWCMVTDNPVIHAARNHLLAAIGGRGSDAQREAIKWAGRHVQPPSDAEIMAIDVHPAEPAARDGGEAREALWLFREFVIRNATQWALGAGHHHPIWAHVSAAIGDTYSPSSGPFYEFICAENTKPLAALAASGEK